MKTLASKLPLCGYILATTLIYHLAVDQAAAQRFGDLITLSTPSNTSNAYEGNSVTGNTITRVVRYTNTSSLTIVIDSIHAVQSLDPEDLGFPNASPNNSADIRRAMLARFPDTDILNLTGWRFLDPPRKTWSTEIVPFNALPLIVEPGKAFQYTRISTNNDFGPDFGPKIANNMTVAEINSIGEISIGIDLNWRIIPEPTGATLALLGLLGMLSARRTLRR